MKPGVQKLVKTIMEDFKNAALDTEIGIKVLELTICGDIEDFLEANDYTHNSDTEYSEGYQQYQCGC